MQRKSEGKKDCVPYSKDNNSIPYRIWLDLENAPKIQMYTSKWDPGPKQSFLLRMLFRFHKISFGFLPRSEPHDTALEAPATALLLKKPSLQHPTFAKQQLVPWKATVILSYFVHLQSAAICGLSTICSGFRALWQESPVSTINVCWLSIAAMSHSFRQAAVLEKNRKDLLESLTSPPAFFSLILADLVPPSLLFPSLDLVTSMAWLQNWFTQWLTDVTKFSEIRWLCGSYRLHNPIDVWVLHNLVYLIGVLLQLSTND